MASLNDPQTRAEVRDLLVKAKARIEGGRWTKGMLAEEVAGIGTCYCAHGAVVESTPIGHGVYENGSFFDCSDAGAYEEAPNEDWNQYQLAHYVLGQVGLTVPFNDRDSTTYEDVIAKFDEAIASVAA